MMTDSWKNEDDIKAELRVLTEELRRLREELRSMVTPAAKPTRALLRRPSWPVPRTLPTEPQSATANETPKRPRRKRSRS